MPMAQATARNMKLVVRANAGQDPMRLAGGVRRAIAELDSLIAAYSESGTFLDTAVVPFAPVHLEGRRIGPYEISALIGEGGMGEVYRARDTKLGRDVAIKALAAAVAQDPDRLFWHCIVNPSERHRWSFGFVVPDNWIDAIEGGR